MLDIFEKLIFPTAFLAPLTLVIFNFIYFRKPSDKNRVVALSAISAALCFIGFAILGIGLFLRDGIAPGYIPTHGMEAFKRAKWEIVPGLILVCISLILTPFFKKPHE